MAKFCGKCGTKLDEKTGLCPNCGTDELKKQQQPQPAAAAAQFSEKEAKEAKKAQKKADKEAKRVQRQADKQAKKAQKKADKKAAKARKKADKKAAKKEKWAAMTLGQKARSVVLKLLTLLLVLAILGAGAAGALVYFDLADIPAVSSLLDRFGIKEKPKGPEGSVYTPNAGALSFDEDTGTAYINNIVIIFFENGTSRQKIESTIQSIGGTVVGSLPMIDQYQVQVASRSLQELMGICEDLKNLDCVYDAIYDTALEVKSDAVPDDPWTKTLLSGGEVWSSENPSGANWWLEAVNAIDAWDDNEDFTNIKIGILDNGFDTRHEDLKNVIAYTSLNNNKEAHGTHVAGIIGAEANNKKGITGLVWNCELYTYDYDLGLAAGQSSERQWITATEIFGGTLELVELGAKVINVSGGESSSMSGTDRPDEEVYSSGYAASLYLHLFLERGYDFLIVQSAGNGNANGTPVDAVYNGLYASINADNCATSKNIGYEEVIGRVVVVGAAQNDGNDRYSQMDSSNAGPRVDICAPGKDIYSTMPGGYGYLSGTSAAAPVVTGVAALTWSVNPDLSGRDIKNIICAQENTEYSVAANLLEEYPQITSYPMVNAKRSVDAARSYLPKRIGGVFQKNDVPDGAVRFGDHYYYIYDTDTVMDWNETLEYSQSRSEPLYYVYGSDTVKNWDDAREYCEAQGGYLATITSEEENAFLHSYMVSRGYNTAMFGLTDQDAADVWSWTTGEAFDYQNWHSGEPDHRDGNEHYGTYESRNRDGSWSDGSGEGIPFICEWGEYETELPARTTSDERDIVLVLDVSGSMSGNPMTETKKASTNFVGTILREDASIGIVTYDDTAQVASDFLMEAGPLIDTISRISVGGSTNIEAGLSTAYDMLQRSSARKKIIVLMSDGEPNSGKEGDELVAYADEIKRSGVLIYTLGFFENMGNRSSAQLLMEQLASDGCHYEVASADDLVFFFEDVADQINGQRYIYVRIACPVDVFVTYNRQTLSSSERRQNLRTDFGTLTLEENEDPSPEEGDDLIKVLRLKEGVDYDIQLIGTGRGIMNYTIGFMDEDGEYSDFRRFEDITITRKTVIDTVASVSDTTVLNVDEDGDGECDIIYQAGENEYAEEVAPAEDPPPYLLIGACAAGGLLLLIVIIVVAVRASRKKKAKNGE